MWSRLLCNPMRQARNSVGYLGPEGSFTHQALIGYGFDPETVLKAFRSVPDVLDGISDGAVGFGFVPIENSIEGAVNITLDGLIFEHNLYIQNEVVIDIRHYVLAKSRIQVGEVTKLYSMPVATAQCHKFLRTEMPNVSIIDTDSTSAAALYVANSTDETIAALAPRLASEIYSLEVLTDDISDFQMNQTRFVLIGRDSIPQQTGNDVTCFVVFQRNDEPGSLISILQEFASRKINLTGLVSRPNKRGGLGSYCFIMYADGHIEDELVADALRELHVKQGSVKFLGSYPAAGAHAHSAREHADARWREADDWVGDLRSRISR